jgi:hypothetical protein
MKRSPAAKYTGSDDGNVWLQSHSKLLLEIVA